MKTNRRDFLRTLGVAAIAAPVVRQSVPRLDAAEPLVFEILDAACTIETCIDGCTIEIETFRIPRGTCSLEVS